MDDHDSQVRPYSASSYLTPQESANSYANVESKMRIPHSPGFNESCEQYLQLHSGPSPITYTG